ncbi:fosfomycin resistance protein FosB [Polystyrenella longa]|uniref:Fosfomycin resistance protein FosB n=1 Tax=Polystyrenella longa TaxID=2528007 RepID=A0A518CJM4_9PLAN|nr:VOC family protein [Polystyrenella longa]QDU79420.1 fosfomycin resistance protein FosB [Polystyrenella longa]
MEPRVSMLGLGVHDLKKSVEFYEQGLGFSLASSSNENIAFFNLSNLVLSLYPWDKLAEDASVPAEGTGFRGVTIAHNVRSKEEVSEILKLAESAGGNIVKPAQDVFWGGHSGYFADIDGHLWEVAWNPKAILDQAGGMLFD